LVCLLCHVVERVGGRMTVPQNTHQHTLFMGDKLRAARHEQNLTLQELAQQANLSVSMLSQIETGKAYPSIHSVYNIASALGLSIDYFFPDHSLSMGEPIKTRTPLRTQPPIIEKDASDLMPQEILSPLIAQAQLLQAAERPTIELDGGVTWSRLTANTENEMEILEIKYDPGATSGETLTHHNGREFGLVLEGELVIQLGFEQFTLGQGDTIVFDATTPHRLANEQSEPMRAVWVLWDTY